MLKYTVLPLALFALMAGSVSAYNPAIFEKLNLTTSQKSALEEAQNIRKDAHEKAEKVLKDAGIDATKMKEIHGAMHDARKASHQAVEAAVEANDFAAFKTAIVDTPLQDAIDTEAEFQKFVEAHKLMEADDREGAKEIMEDLGITHMKGMMGGGHGGRGGKGFGGGMKADPLSR